MTSPASAIHKKSISFLLGIHLLGSVGKVINITVYFFRSLKLVWDLEPNKCEWNFEVYFGNVFVGVVYLTICLFRFFFFFFLVTFVFCKPGAMFEIGWKKLQFSGFMIIGSEIRLI